MEVYLIEHTHLSTAVKAIRTCWSSQDKGGCYTDATDDIIDSDKKLMYRVANKFKHASTIEHINYSFDIDGISRACLQELARHRHQSLSVKSSRYTLKELQDARDFEMKAFLVSTGNKYIDNKNQVNLTDTREALNKGLSNDIVKYMLPEAYKTSLVSTMNMRALQNFLSLRTDKSALWEIQELAHKMFDVLPEEHKFMLEDFVKHY